MAKVAFVFPGQGSQYVGMGAELAAAFPAAAAVFREADAVLGYSLSEICFRGPGELLARTRYTQPAVFTVSMAVLTVLRSRGLEPAAVAGHSLGEYTALAAAGVWEFPVALRLVARRAALMEEAVAGVEGGMSAVLGLPPEEVVSLCARARERGLVVPANFNAPDQVVVSGTKAGLAEVARLAREAGGRVVPLQVAGPFHSPFMEGVAAELSRLFAETPFASPALPFVANATGDYVGDPAALRRVLALQVKSPVLWVDCVRKLADSGCDTFVEVGPGRVLTGLIKKIVPGARLFAVGDVAGLEKMVAQWKGSV